MVARLPIPACQLSAEEASARDFDTVFDLIARGESPAIRSVDEHIPALSFDQLKAFVGYKGPNLNAFGVGQGHRLCTVLPNGPESAVAICTFMVQCTIAPLSPFLNENELIFEFADIPADCVVIMDGASKSVHS